MPPPISSAGQAERAHFPHPDASTIKNPINEGVDSHRIEFQLENLPQIAEVQTVVGASSGESARVNDAIENLKPRLLELYKNGSSLVSFGSSNSFNRVKNIHKQPVRANSFSLIEQILAAFNKPQLEGIPLSDTVTLKSIAIDSKTDMNELSFHGGTITFTKQGEPDREIMFQELCPAYDGKTLTSETLLAALKHVPETKASNSTTTYNKTNTTHPQFYSAKGIGRSASLAVLYSFKEMCTQKNGFDPNEVMQHLGALIKQGRAQRNEHFVNTKAQEDELLKACEQINNETKKTRKRMEGAQRSPFNHSAAAAFPAASTNAPPKVEAVPKPVHTSTPNPPPDSSQQERRVNKTITTLTKIKPKIGGITNEYPYMPINAKGITDLANRKEFEFPRMTISEAKDVATDIFRAGFHGDALGSDLETRFFLLPAHVLPSKLKTKTRKLIEGMNDDKKSEFNNAANDPEKKDDLLISQLKLKNNSGHCATDDTQQGALSTISKMNWLSRGDNNLDTLAQETMWAFHKPQFPSQGSNPPREFDIRGGANTFYMCKFTDKNKENWRDVAIEDVALIRDKNMQVTGISLKGGRAGGAGNGGMMRIGYDLLPLLASGATTQDLVEQVLISNQVTHPSSFSAVACVGQAMLMAKCILFRQQEAGKKPPTELPKNFFIDTYYEVAKAIEHPEQLFNLEPEYSRKLQGYTEKEWRIGRLPSEFLKAPNSPNEAIKKGSVEQALIDSAHLETTSQNIDSVLQRWGSNSYLGATFPTVVFLLEKFGYDNPALAVNMAALVTKDSDTCATIIAQVMGALHGSGWVDNVNSTFDQRLGGGFTLDNLIAHIHNFYDKREAPQKTQPAS